MIQFEFLKAGAVLTFLGVAGRLYVGQFKQKNERVNDLI